MLTRDSKDIGICFQHVSWAVKEYEYFFNIEVFNAMLVSVLDSYVPYFTDRSSRSWDILGSEKEKAKYIWSQWLRPLLSGDILIRFGILIRGGTS
jgi:hypothetical protein